MAVNRAEDGIRLSPQVQNSIIDYEERIVSGSLVSDGVQYSNEVDTAVINTDVTIFEKTIEPEIKGGILWVEFGLTAAFRAVASATVDLIWKWQARNKGGTWVDLHSGITETDIGAAYVERTRQGYFDIESNFSRVPFDLRLILQANEADEGRSKVKNSSYVRAIFKPRK